ncbi:MAG: arylamine N-acetyltransferase [Myxococcota bacterium]
MDAYLARLGAPGVRHDRAGLAALQAAHLMAVPFHNLLLLANDGRSWGLTALEKVVDEAIAGVGGNCDRTTPPFAALLQSLGFDARLAAATVREPGDHFVCLAQADGCRFLCDVGNGHPYLRPWDLDGPVQEQSFHGWRFRFDPRAPAGPTLTRHLGDGGTKTVYILDPTPRAYDEFTPMVRAHYTQAGFGPFLSSLRAVRIQPDVVLTLRDGEYARDTPFGRSVRRVVGREAVSALLVERFGLPRRLVEDAIAVLARRRPELFGDEPRWLALGRGHIEESAHVEPPTRSEVPDVLVSLPTVGRGASVRRLLDTLAEEVRASGYPGHVGVLLVENHPPDATATVEERPNLPVHRVPIASLRPALERAARVGVLPALDERLPVPIGAAREAQLAAIRAHLDAPVAGLPHPARHPMVVWMVDDDLAFQQLGEDGVIRRRTHLLFRVARYWSTLPHRAVVIGTFTGDPPVPGLDSLGGQLHDLAANVARMATLGPDAAWEPPPAPPPLFDAYYDLTDAPVEKAEAVWPYAPNLVERPVRDVALALLDDLPRLLDGQQLTRALAWDGRDTPPRPSLRRGGNTLFLDIDALFRWPTPVLACADGVTTRRGDTIWATLAHSEQPGAVVEATLPLLHGREGQAPRATRATAAHDGAAETTAQVRGVVLARALSEGRPVADELRAREARVASQRRELRERIAGLRDTLLGLAAWGDAGIDEAVDHGLDALEALDRLAAAGAPIPGDADELEAFLSRLPDAVRAWRGAW